MHIITQGARHAPTHQLDLFTWESPAHFVPEPLRLAALRLSARSGVPFRIALVHAEQAGLGKEAS
ncbi:hypothetical protein [Azorhizobium doebereinerae]|uniref:hypothetical protein n=1 Tax=Azorhizobium doebereinerae TaxID=281091 RepID=UPI00049065C8|nr:hypothetical protein [Azorhizobium doebereinerae]